MLHITCCILQVGEQEPLEMLEITQVSDELRVKSDGRRTTLTGAAVSHVDLYPLRSVGSSPTPPTGWVADAGIGQPRSSALRLIAGPFGDSIAWRSTHNDRSPGALVGLADRGPRTRFSTPVEIRVAIARTAEEPLRR